MSLASQLFLAVGMVLVSIVVMMVIALVVYRKLAKARPALSYSIYHRERTADDDEWAARQPGGM